MKLVTFQSESNVRTGLLLDGSVLDLDAAARVQPGDPVWGRDMVSLIRDADRSVPWLKELLTAPPAGCLLDLAEVRLLAPIPRPEKNVFCVGLNYLDHIAEQKGPKRSATERPILFTKPATAVIGPQDDVPLHPVTEQLDYEVELGVVIGRGGSYIRAADAWDHVFGLTIINDVTARDLQAGHGGQWFKGKALDGSCPMGPAIVHISAVSQPENLNFTCTVNGEIRQRSNTGLMIFDVPAIIESLSAGLTLEPGDVIATGTCSGVGKGFDPPRFLNHGDVVELTIEQVGTLRNRVVRFQH